MARAYEVLFYNGWGSAPAYYLVDSVETPRSALRHELGRVLSTVRAEFDLDTEVSDRKICESLYVLRSNGLVGALEV